jgi:hypothetical protein
MTPNIHFHSADKNAATFSHGVGGNGSSRRMAMYSELRRVLVFLHGLSFERILKIDTPNVKLTGSALLRSPG